MAEIKSQFFNGKTYSATDFVESNKNTMKDGILPNTDFFKVLPAGNMKIGVTSGRGWIQGHAFSSNSTLSFTIDSADGVLDRIDTVIIRLDLTTDNEKIECKVIKGAFGGSAAAPVRNGTYYDLIIAEIVVAHGTTAITEAMITDTRADNAKCGWAGAISNQQYLFDGKADKTEVKALAYDYGDIKLTACAKAPDKWLLCQGQAISRITYANLFAAIGTLYGAGDKATTFNLPNLVGRVPVGGGTGYTLASTGGEKTHTLDVYEMPTHSHTYSIVCSDYFDKEGTAVDIETKTPNGATNHYSNRVTITKTTASTGSGAAHNNMQPYLTLNYIIFAGV